jgi:DNA-binding PadR family transcriptional regulator
MNRTAEPASYLPLHPLEFRILMALLEGPSHGYRIVQTIEAKAGLVVWPANLYRRIRDLTARGLIEETEAPAGEADDARRTYLKASELGVAVARAETARLKALLTEAQRHELLEGA